jgi:excisionase family DNA binding protein
MATEYTIKEAAQKLGVSEATVRRRIKKGEMRVELRDSPYGQQYIIPETEVNTTQVINNVVRVDRPIPLEKLVASFQQALQAHDHSLTQRLEEISQGKNEATAREIAALHNEMRLLRETLAKSSRPWWQRLMGR